MYRKFLFFSLLAAHTVSAEVPHTFHSGEPAFASEVNENFRYLDEKLTDMDASCKASQRWENALGVQSPTYSYIEASPGHEITINDGTYYIVKLPFIHPISGEIYTVTIPTEKTEANDSGPDYVQQTLIVQPLTAYVRSPCNDLEIGEYKAEFSFFPYTSYTYYNRGGTYQYITDSKPSFSLRIDISNIAVTINLKASELSTTNLGPTLPNNYDFTELLTTENYSPPDYVRIVNTFDQLLDYVFVEKVSDSPAP